jgi:hypothetical protein
VVLARKARAKISLYKAANHNSKKKKKKHANVAATPLSLQTILAARRSLHTSRRTDMTNGNSHNHSVHKENVKETQNAANQPFVMSLSALAGVKLRKTVPKTRNTHPHTNAHAATDTHLTPTAQQENTSNRFNADSRSCSSRSRLPFAGVSLRKSNIKRSPGGTPARRKLEPSLTYSTTNQFHRSLALKFRSVSRLAQSPPAADREEEEEDACSPSSWSPVECSSAQRNSPHRRSSTLTCTPLRPVALAAGRSSSFASSPLAADRSSSSASSPLLKSMR